MLLKVTNGILFQAINKHNTPPIIMSGPCKQDEPFQQFNNVREVARLAQGRQSQGFRRIRRRPGSEQLGSQLDGAAVKATPRTGHGRSIHASVSSLNDITSGAQSLLQSIKQADSDQTYRRKRIVQSQRTLWEGTLSRQRAAVYPDAKAHMWCA